MKATLEFKLPDERSEYEYARMGMDSHLVIWKMWQRLTQDHEEEKPNAYWIDFLLFHLDDLSVPLEVRE